jgi:sugar lactone lactonase YvrE
MAALGTCGGAASGVVINELTTVAAVYALNGFFNAATADDVHGKDPGLTNAMTTAGMLVDVTSGQLTPPVGFTANDCTNGVGGSIPPNCGAEYTMNSLANALAACVQSAGVLSASCQSLFSASAAGQSLPGGSSSDTLYALRSIAGNPGRVSAGTVYNVSKLSTVFAPAYPAAPNDWTLALNIVDTTNNLDNPQGIAIDAEGYVWVTSFGSTPSVGVELQNVCRFSPRALAESTSIGHLGGGLTGPMGIAIDLTGNVWAANAGGQTYHANSLSEFTPGNYPDGLQSTALSPSAGFGGFTGGGIVLPGNLAIDPTGNVWVVNSNSSISEMGSAGTPVSSSNGYTGGGLNKPAGIAVDSTGNVWVTNSNVNEVSEFSSTGAVLSPASPGSSPGVADPIGIAIDPMGYVWVANTGGSSGYSLSKGGSHSPGFTMVAQGGGLDYAYALAVDASGNVWAADYGTDAVTEFSTSPSVIPLSPNATASTDGGFQGGGLYRPTGIAVDPSGNVWVVNGRNTGMPSLTEFVGAAAPTRTPLIAAITQGFTP